MKNSSLILLPLILSVMLMGIILLSCGRADRNQLEAFNSFNLGVKAVKSDNMDLASSYFKRAVILKPDFTEAKMNLANTHFLKGDLDKARDEYSALLAEKVFDPRLLFNLAWIYMLQEDYQTAEELFTKSRKIDAEFTDSDYGLAVLAYRMNENEVAGFYLKKYLDESPNGRWVDKAESLILSLPSGNFSNHQTETPDLEPEIVTIPLEMEEEEKEEVQPSQFQEVEHQPAKPEPSEDKSVEKPKQAKEEKIIKSEPVKPSPPIKQPEKAIKPESVKTGAQLINDAKYSLNHKDYKSAEKFLKQALELDKNLTDANFLMAKLYFIRGRSTDELKYVTATLKSKNVDVNNQFEQAEIYYQIGDIDKAIESYRQYLKNSPFGGNADKAKNRLTELDKHSNDS